MVRVPDIGQNPRVAQHRPDGLGGHRIVDPPTFVVRSGIRAEAPPRIQVRLRMKNRSVSMNPPSMKRPIHSRSSGRNPLTVALRTGS